MTAPALHMSCDVDHIPGELKERPQWVNWKPEERAGKVTKVPYSPGTGRLADSTARFTWSSLDRCVAWGRRYGMGIGFVFSADDPFAGVDLDKCIEAGRILPWAWDIVQALDSYTDVSPSDSGLKVIVRGQLPPGRRGWGNGNGMYDRARFFTITGRRIDYLPPSVEERGEALAALHARLFPPAAPRAATERGAPATDLDDAEIVRRAMGARNGHKFSKLWLGDWGDYSSPSEADMALCSMLAFWCGGDTDRVSRLFAGSGLYREGKWGRATYRERTVERASRCAAYYAPRPHRSRATSRDGRGPAAAGRVRL